MAIQKKRVSGTSGDVEISKIGTVRAERIYSVLRPVIKNSSVLHPVIKNFTFGFYEPNRS